MQSVSGHQLCAGEIKRRPGSMSRRWDLTMLITLVCSSYFKDSAEFSPSCWLFVRTPAFLSGRLRILGQNLLYSAVDNEASGIYQHACARYLPCILSFVHDDCAVPSEVVLLFVHRSAILEHIEVARSQLLLLTELSQCLIQTAEQSIHRLNFQRHMGACFHRISRTLLEIGHTDRTLCRLAFRTLLAETPSHVEHCHSFPFPSILQTLFQLVLSLGDGQFPDSPQVSSWSKDGIFAQKNFELLGEDVTRVTILP